MGTRIESAEGIHRNFLFLISYAYMSTDDLQKIGADLARKYSIDLNIVDFCQKLHVFKKQAPLIIGINKQQVHVNCCNICAFPKIRIALRKYCTLPTISASCEVSSN